MKYYLLDTSTYGVLPDKSEVDYSIIKKVIEYAKRNRELFVTTLIIANEIGSEQVDKRIRKIVLPEYCSTISRNMAPLEIMFSDKYEKAEKLAWNYIQRLTKKDADESMPDALNYAWCSVAGVDTFVTRNRRGILADNYHRILRKSNRKMGVKFVKIMTPTEFYELLV